MYTYSYGVFLHYYLPMPLLGSSCLTMQTFIKTNIQPFWNGLRPTVHIHAYRQRRDNQIILRLKKSRKQNCAMVTGDLFTLLASICLSIYKALMCIWGSRKREFLTSPEPCHTVGDVVFRTIFMFCLIFSRFKGLCPIGFQRFWFIILKGIII